MEEEIAVIWIGPSGDNPVLGTVITGNEMILSKDNFEYFHPLKLVKKAPKKEEKIIEQKSKK